MQPFSLVLVETSVLLKTACMSILSLKEEERRRRGGGMGLHITSHAYVDCSVCWPVCIIWPRIMSLAALGHTCWFLIREKGAAAHIGEAWLRDNRRNELLRAKRQLLLEGGGGDGGAGRNEGGIIQAKIGGGGGGVSGQRGWRRCLENRGDVAVSNGV